MSPRPVVLVGAREDDHVRAVADALRARGFAPVVFDSLAFPHGAQASLGEAVDAIVLDGRPCARPAAVYLRSLYLSPVAFMVDASASMDQNWRRTLVAFREKGEFLLSLCKRWETLGVPVYNPPSASDASRKPYQLARLADAGLPIAPTLWSNDPAAVRRFCESRRVVYKPVSGGAATRELTAEDLAPERLARLAGAPVTFQELLPGEDLRVFVLDGRVAAAFRIATKAIDYRQNEDSIEAIVAPPDLERSAIAAAATLGMRFSGIDFKRDAHGRPRLLECNPSPMFLGFDQRAGTRLLDALTDALAAHAR